MTELSPDWEEYVHRQCPGFLLPDAEQSALDVERARILLERLTRRPDQYELIATASILVAHRSQLRDLASRWLPDLVRNLPSRTQARRRTWSGGFQGRLDIPATLAARRGLDSTVFVTRQRLRTFDLLETVLIAHVARRLVGVLQDLRRRGVTSDVSGWSSDFSTIEGQLQSTLLRSRLADLSEEPVDDMHLRASRAARHPAYRIATKVAEDFRALVDQPDPATAARVVAGNALQATTRERRFELAVLIRWIEALWGHLQRQPGERWTWERALVVPGRKEIAVFQESDGREIAVHFDNAVLGPGPRDLGVSRYLGGGGRIRPDITVLRRRNGQIDAVWPIEIKCSEDVGYLAHGYQEAQIYALEYGTWSAGSWPAAMLVVPRRCLAAPDPQDRVIAIGWPDWPTASLLATVAG